MEDFFGDEENRLMRTPGFAPRENSAPKKTNRPMPVAPPGLFGQPQAPQPSQQHGAQQMHPPQPQMHAPAQADWMHPMQREALQQYQKGLSDTNNAIAREMDSRVEQTKEFDDRAHEENLASMKYGAEMAKSQAELAARQQDNAARAQRNAALMRAAGIGGTTIVNGKPIDAFGPLRSSLLG